MSSFLKFWTCRSNRSELRILRMRRWSPRRKERVEFPAEFPYFRRFSRVRLSLLLESVYDDLRVPRKLAMSSSERHKLARSQAWACQIWHREQRLPECFFVTESHFPTKITARPGKILEIQELHVVAERVFFLEVLNLWINSQRAKKTLRGKVIPQDEKTC